AHNLRLLRELKRTDGASTRPLRYQGANPRLSCMTSTTTDSRGVAILGSTGSIGCNSLRVIESLTTTEMHVVALAAGTNVERLADQIAKHLPEVVSVDTEAAAHDLRAMLFARDVDLP